MAELEMPSASDETERSSSSSTICRSPSSFATIDDSWPTMIASSRASTCGGGNSIMFSFSLQRALVIQRL